MSKDPIIPPMDTTPENLAKLLLRATKSEVGWLDSDQNRQTTPDQRGTKKKEGTR